MNDKPEIWTHSTINTANVLSDLFSLELIVRQNTGFVFACKDDAVICWKTVRLVALSFLMKIISGQEH